MSDYSRSGIFFRKPVNIYLALTGTRAFTLLWDSSRVIQDTINEYPLFSFLFGDVHAHVLGILAQSFLVLMVTAAIVCWRDGTRTRILILLLTALGLSVIPVVNELGCPDMGTANPGNRVLPDWKGICRTILPQNPGYFPRKFGP